MPSSPGVVLVYTRRFEALAPAGAGTTGTKTVSGATVSGQLTTRSRVFRLKRETKLLSLNDYFFTIFPPAPRAETGT